MEAISVFSPCMEPAQEVRGGMSTSVKAHTRMTDSDSMCKCIFVCTQARLRVCFDESVAAGFYLKSGQTGLRETSKDWMMDAGQSLNLMNGLRYVSN